MNLLPFNPQSLLGGCPDYNVVSGFQAEAYLGKWYELARSEGTSWFQSGECDTAEYTKRDDGYLGIDNSEHKTSSKGLKPRTHAEAQARFKDGDESKAALQVKFSPFQPGWFPYNVLETDYEFYAVIYACSDVAGQVKFENAWVLSREPLAKEDAKFQALLDIGEKVLAREAPKFDFGKSMRKTHQGADCVY